MSPGRWQNDRMDLYFQFLIFIFVETPAVGRFRGNSERPTDFLTILNKLTRAVIW